MFITGSQALLAGAVCSAVAALTHLGCIAWGAPAYRLLGAGERMARAAEAGEVQPTLVTLAIAGLLFLWSAYALGGAGVIGPLPFSSLALPAIALAYLGRAVVFPLLMPAFPENSLTFWLVSSGICLCIGLVHGYGVVAVWHSL